MIGYGHHEGTITLRVGGGLSIVEIVKRKAEIFSGHHHFIPLRLLHTLYQDASHCPLCWVLPSPPPRRCWRPPKPQDCRVSRCRRGEHFSSHGTFFSEDQSQSWFPSYNHILVQNILSISMESYFALHGSPKEVQRGLSCESKLVVRWIEGQT